MSDAYDDLFTAAQAFAGWREAEELIAAYRSEVLAEAAGEAALAPEGGMPSERLAAIAAEVERSRQGGPANVGLSEVVDLLGEVQRLQGEVAHSRNLRAELDSCVAAIAQVRETCVHLWTDPDEQGNPYRVGQDKAADVILEQLDEHYRKLIEQQRAGQ